jgi:hypothetical protein
MIKLSEWVVRHGSVRFTLPNKVSRRRVTEQLRILCVGEVDPVKTTRVLVLESKGFEVTQSTAGTALSTLEVSTFDLIIFSKEVAESVESEICLAASPKTRFMSLQGLTYPSELLTKIQEAVSPEVPQS